MFEDISKTISVIAKEMKRRELDVSWHNSARLNSTTPVKIFITRLKEKEVQQTDHKFDRGCLMLF